MGCGWGRVDTMFPQAKRMTKRLLSTLYKSNHCCFVCIFLFISVELERVPSWESKPESRAHAQTIWFRLGGIMRAVYCKQPLWFSFCAWPSSVSTRLPPAGPIHPHPFSIIRLAMWNTFRRGEQCPKVELPTRAPSHAPLYLQTSRFWKVAGIRKFTGIYIYDFMCIHSGLRSHLKG